MKKVEKTLRSNAVLTVVMLALSVIWGCNLEDRIIEESTNWRTATENVLQDAIESLNSASADWQEVLQEAQEKLTDDAQSTIRNELANLASRSVAQAGVEMRCDVDFMRRRVQRAVERIEIRFDGGQPAPVEPALCQVVPLKVDRELVPDRISAIEFYGYDFDHADDLTVFHVRADRRENVTGKLDRPTHYAMTLKFGSNGVQLRNDSQRISLEWGGRAISTIAVIQPQAPVCKSRVVRFQPEPVTFVPPHTRGDHEFAGHGPTSTASVTLLTDPRRIRAEVRMHAYESNPDNSPRKDDTTASGSGNFHVYTAPLDWRIERVLGPLRASKQYRDNDHADDPFDMGGGLVRRFVFVGDTRGAEAGHRTKVDVFFNRLSVELKQTKDCVQER